MQTTYRIHPAIGIARVGNSAEGWYLGPELPRALIPPPAGTFRDAAGRLKRQAARFRVYEYAGGQAVREVTGAEAEITWRIRLANRKPVEFHRDVPQGVAIEPPEAVVHGGERWTMVGSIWDREVMLAELQTDGVGRLLALSGYGRSESQRDVPARDVHNPWWFDDLGDGPVSATVRLRGTGQQEEAAGAWLVTAPPDYAPHIPGLVTLYDRVAEAATELSEEVRLLQPATTSFRNDILPLLQRASRRFWVSRQHPTDHDPGSPGDLLRPETLALVADPQVRPQHRARRQREEITDLLLLPGAGRYNWPTAAELLLTRVQETHLTRWRDGAFVADWPPAAAVPTCLDDLPVAQQPAALDRAQLEACNGEGFLPGIEVGRVALSPETYASPFRVRPDLPPGSLTAGLAVPWQVDVRLCTWWPSAIPYSVGDGREVYRWLSGVGRDDLVHGWPELGFMVRDPVTGQFVEFERRAPR